MYKNLQVGLLTKWTTDQIAKQLAMHRHFDCKWLLTSLQHTFPNTNHSLIILRIQQVQVFKPIFKTIFIVAKKKKDFKTRTLLKILTPFHIGHFSTRNCPRENIKGNGFYGSVANIGKKNLSSNFLVWLEYSGYIYCPLCKLHKFARPVQTFLFF